jgi:GR25 family glycosyltransferase involved in LPS biosynthesis
MDARTDRKSILLREFERVGFPDDKIMRFPASSYHGCANTGCLLSHANALEMAYNMNFQNVLILEDDFVFIDDTQKIHNDIKSFFELKIDWDVVMFTTCAAVVSENTNSLISRISSSGNGAGYLVNRPMMLELSTLFKANVENLFSTKQHWIYQNDILWKTIMATSQWYMFNHYLGYQKEGYSDLSQDQKIAIVPQVIEAHVINEPQVINNPNKDNSYTSDSIVNSVIRAFIGRSNVGLQKYGTTLDRDDLSILDWIQHAQEEHMDAILYLEKLKSEYIKKN